MIVSALTYNETFSKFLKAALRDPEAGNVHTAFETFAADVRQKDSTLDLIVIDSHFLRENVMDKDVMAYLDRQQARFLVIDDIAGCLTSSIEDHGRYPAGTIGVVSGEVLAEPQIMKEVLSICEQGQAWMPVQDKIYKLLAQTADLWGMDPVFTEQYGLKAA